MPFCVCASLSLSLGVCVLAVTWAPAAPDSVCVFPITALAACCFTGIPLSCFTDFENCFLFIFFTLKGNITYVQKLNAHLSGVFHELEAAAVELSRTANQSAVAL